MSIDLALALKLHRLKNPRICVLGDRLSDQDIHGHFRGFAQESSACPVFVADWSEGRPGGMGAVAAMVQALGGSTFQVFGKLSTKCRFYVDGKQVFRFDSDATSEGPLETANIQDAISYSDCVLIADYGKGVVTPEICKAVIDGAKRKGIPVIVDPHGNDWSKYDGATCIKCNEREVPPPAKYDEWLKLSIGLYVTTLGHLGMTLCNGVPDNHFQARRRKVADVTGAGDMVLACLGVCIASGLSWEDSCQIANAAAGCKVEKHGAVPVPRAEIVMDLIHGLKQIPVELLGAVSAVRRKIVLTNGAYDCLHPGHHHLLTEARAMGEHLVVAVNDDQSVRQLKGPTRPIVPLEQRAAMLAALSCVDFVVPFGSEAELEQICATLKPDVLVKGGSYSNRVLTGQQHAKEVRLVPMLPDMSTTRLLERLGRSA